MIPLNLIVCATKSNGIGQSGRLPWRLKHDMNFFKHVTTLAAPTRKNVVVMGRKTWESIPERFRPLSNRINIVISRQSTAEVLGINPQQDSYLVNSIDSACRLINELDNHDQSKHREGQTDESQHHRNVNKVFVIGGSELYKTILEPQSQGGLTKKLFKPVNILMTRIISDHQSVEEQIDSYFPEFRSDPSWTKSNDLNVQEDFLTLGNCAEGGTIPVDQQLSRFKFDQLIIEDSFIYKFELWTNVS